MGERYHRRFLLDATLSREPDQAEVLLGSDLKKIISPEQHSNEIRNWLADEVYNQGYRSKSLQVEEIALIRMNRSSKASSKART